MSPRVKANRVRLVFVASVLFLACAALFGTAGTVAQSAKGFPSKEITVIVPWSAGGGADLISRQLAVLMEKDLGKPVIVVNRTGGGGCVGFQVVAASKPDGHTICLVSPALLLQKYTSLVHVDYRLFKPVALLNEDPAGLTVNANAPWKNISEFFEDARKNPGKMRVANSGTGTTWHVAALAMENKAGVKFTHVPYEGANPAAAAVAGGHIEATTASPAEVAPLVAAGKLRILAIPYESRDPKFANVPTFREEGLDFCFSVWRAYVVPKDTPDAIVEVLCNAFRKAYESQEFKDFMVRAGFGMKFMDSAEFGALLERQDIEFGALLSELQMEKK